MTEKKPATRTVSLNAVGVQKIAEIASANGMSTRQFFEALMHHAISQWERPGSWEADQFDIENYGPDGCADRWF